ncbi:MAG: hypothetical protein OSA97_14810, partial [Nevskia sp.]|nr:hypothetical protein [Nevskia sp.]
MAACTLPFAVLAQPESPAAAAPAAAPADAASTPATAAATPAAAPVAGQGLGSQTRFGLATQTSG